MKTTEKTFLNVLLRVEKKTALDDKQYFCIVRKDTNRVIEKHKLKRDAIYRLHNLTSI